MEPIDYQSQNVAADETRPAKPLPAEWVWLIYATIRLAAGVVCLVYGARVAFTGAQALGTLRSFYGIHTLLAEWPGIALMVAGTALAFTVRPPPGR